MKELLFSASGRLNRSRFWWSGIAISLVSSIVMAGVVAGLWALKPGQVDGNGGFSVDGVIARPYIAAFLVYTVICVWTGLCLGIKRYHDLDKSGAWMLVMLIPVVDGLIYFIQAGCLRGTTGTNRYGPDPSSNVGFA